MSVEVSSSGSVAATVGKSWWRVTMMAPTGAERFYMVSATDRTNAVMRVFEEVNNQTFAAIKVELMKVDGVFS
jgi:hypothetical protein